MKTLGSWTPFEETASYRKFKQKLKQRKFQKKKEQDFKDLKIEVRNQSKLDHEKILSKINYFSKSTFNKFAPKQSWRLKVWLQESSKSQEAKYVCGIALSRPHRPTIFVKKMAENCNEAIKESLATMTRSMYRDKFSWNRNLFEGRAS